MNAITNVHAFQREEQFPRLIAAELEVIRSTVLAACPASATVTLAFDGHLNLFIDVRTLEEAGAVEAVLPSLMGGIFGDMRRSGTPHQPFRHRVTATVNA